jgi:hypothetical protein
LRYDPGVVETMAPFPAETVASIEAVASSQRTLEDVVRWGLAQATPRLVERVVVQDEYTHDVVLRWGDEVFLVYDTS